MTFYQVFILLIAIIAAVISLVSLVRTRKTQAEQIELQRATAALAKKQLEMLVREESELNKARIDVSIEEYRNAHRFVLTNIGQAPAKNVAFSIEPRKHGSSPLVISDYEEKIPIPSLSPGAEVGVLAAFSMGSATAFNVKVSWDNPDGTSVKDEVFVAL